MIEPQTEKAAGRTSTLLSARICWAGGENKAFIRNISEMGALLETEAELTPRESVTLKRDDLEVEGHVVWAKDHSCGIRFLSTVDPTVWIGEEKPKTPTLASASLKQLLEEGKDVNSLIEKRLAEEIAFAARLIENFGDTLSRDAVICNRYPTQLQNISIALQMLTEISYIVSSNDKLAEVESRSTGPMKARILR